MIPDNVTLVVKAPNQQIQDQTIECRSSWSIRELKAHLSEVYPNKPKTDEQKIIYSGQLLDDNAILKDVLRTYWNQVTHHTMHLVCTPKQQPEEPATRPGSSTAGLRCRNVILSSQRPEIRQNDQNHSVEMQNYLSSYMNAYGRVPQYPNYNFTDRYLPMPNDPALLANHMMMMQQAYVQYMQQYANMWQQPSTIPQAAPPAAPAAPAAPEAPPQPPAPEPPVQEDGEEVGARDWLDHLYAASRLAILFSLVYLYGSPARLLLVVLLAGVGYLHRIGYFRDLHVNPAHDAMHHPQPRQQEPLRNRIQEPVRAPGPDRVPEPNRATEHAGAPEPTEAPEPARAPEPAAAPEPNRAPEPTESAPTANRNPQIDENQSLLAVTWMIFSTFFASLIPETN